MAQEIYLIDNDNGLKNTLTEMFKGENEYKFKKVDTKRIDEALKNIPSLIIINEDMIDDNIIDLCKRIRANEDNVLRPLILSFIDNQIYDFADEKVIKDLQIRDIMKTMDKRIKLDQATVDEYMRKYNSK